MAPADPAPQRTESSGGAPLRLSREEADGRRAQLFALRAELFAADPDFKGKSFHVLNGEALAFLSAGDDARCVAAYAKLFRKARENNTTHAHLYACHNNRARAYLNLGLYEEALWDARTAGHLAELRFSQVGGAAALGSGMGGSAEAKAAVDAYAKSLERYGWAQLGMGASRLARATFEQGLQLKPASQEMARGCEEAAQCLLGDLLSGRTAHQPLALPPPTSGGDRISHLPYAAPLHKLHARALLPSALLSPFAAQSDHAVRDTYNYATVQADVMLPKRQLAVLADEGRRSAWAGAIAAACYSLSAEDKDVRVLHLGAGGGGGLLPLLSLREGARHVTCCERWLYLATACRESLVANKADAESFTVLYKRPCDLLLRTDVPVACNLLIADMFEDGLLSAGLLPAIRTALEKLTIPGGTLVLPSSATVYVQPLELRSDRVCGYDVSAVNLGRWEPGHTSGKPLSPLLSSVSEGGCRCMGLGPPVRAWCFDMLSPPGESESKAVELCFEQTGRFNAVRFWFELTLGEGGQVLSTAPPGLASPGAFLSTSMHPAVSYLAGEVSVDSGDIRPLRCSHNTVALAFDLEQEEYLHLYASLPHSIPPAALHELADEPKAAAFEAAIRRAVARRRVQHPTETVRALDIGTGSGLLAMMCARAGCVSVSGVEISEPLCVAARRNVAANGLARTVRVHWGDAGSCERGHQVGSDGANLVVFDLFDCGLLGDRAVPLLAQLRRAACLEPGFMAVPAAATVYCMGVEAVTAPVDGFQFAASLDKYRWEPGYEQLPLSSSHRQLTKPKRVLETFFDAQNNNSTQEGLLKFDVIADGLLNAVVFWFDLHLDEEATITSAPPGFGPGGEPEGSFDAGGAAESPVPAAGEGDTEAGMQLMSSGGSAGPAAAASAPAPAPPRAGSSWGQAIQYLERTLRVSAGSRQTVLFRVEGERLSFGLRAGEEAAEWCEKPPWRITWGGGASVESPHFQRLHYTELLVKEFLMRVKCRRFPPIEKDMRMVLAHCGSLYLDPEALAVAFRHLVALENMQLMDELSPLACVEAVSKPHRYVA